MIRLVMAGGVALLMIILFMKGQLDSANDRAVQLGSDNTVLTAASALNVATIAQLESDLATERKITKDREAKALLRNTQTREKLDHVEQQNKTGWYGDSLPVSAVCLLTSSEQAADSYRNRICGERATKGLVEADPSTKIKNKTLTKLTLNLQNALESCNADKADILTWLDSHHD